MGSLSDRSHLFIIILVLGANAGMWFPSCAQVADLASYFTLSSPERSEFLDGGQEILISLEEIDGSGFSSMNNYMFGVFNMRVKMIAGNSAGTVTTLYFTSFGDYHDELDFEFLGNETGQPIILQTNVYAHGVGDREQRIFLWFDPSADYHNYTILWNTYHVVFYVDGIPIRVYTNIEATSGVPYLQSQPMSLIGTIWDGDTWATQGGRVKIDWTQAPFKAFYKEFSVDACDGNHTTSTCASTKWWNDQQFSALDDSLLGKLYWVRENYMIYDYCTDYTRFNVTPTECSYTIPTLSSTTTSSSTSDIPTPYFPSITNGSSMSTSSSTTSPSSSPSIPPTLAPSSQQSTSSPPFYHHSLSLIISLILFSTFYAFVM